MEKGRCSELSDIVDGAEDVRNGERMSPAKRVLDSGLYSRV